MKRSLVLLGLALVVAALLFGVTPVPPAEALGTTPCATATTFDTLAVKADGTLWAWGANACGELGTGNTLPYMVPTQIGSASDWRAVALGGGWYTCFAVAIKQDGTLWAWGYNLATGVDILVRPRSAAPPTGNRSPAVACPPPLSAATAPCGPGVPTSGGSSGMRRSPIRAAPNRSAAPATGPVSPAVPPIRWRSRPTTPSGPGVRTTTASSASAQATTACMTNRSRSARPPIGRVWHAARTTTSAVPRLP